MKAWEGKGSVFVVTKSLEIYQELLRLNDPSMCRWLSASTSCGDRDGRDGRDGIDGEDDDDTKSTSTVQMDDAAPDIGVICLVTPQLSYEKAKAGLPTCFLFGRDSARRKIDVCLGRKNKTSLSRVHFALGLKNDTWAVQNMFGSGTLVNRDTMLNPDMPSYALWPGRVNHICAADIELDLYCRNSRDAATYLMDHRYPPVVPPDSRTESSGTSLTTTGTVPLPNVPPELANRLYLLEEQVLPTRTAIKKFLAMDGWTCDRYVFKKYPSSMAQQDALNKRLTLLRPLPVSS